MIFYRVLIVQYLFSLIILFFQENAVFGIFVFCIFADSVFFIIFSYFEKYKIIIRGRVTVRNSHASNKYMVLLGGVIFVCGVFSMNERFVPKADGIYEFLFSTFLYFSVLPFVAAMFLVGIPFIFIFSKEIYGD